MKIVQVSGPKTLSEQEVKTFLSDLEALRTSATSVAIDRLLADILMENGSLDMRFMNFTVPAWIQVKINELQKEVNSELRSIQYYYVEERELLDGWKGDEVQTSGISHRSLEEPSYELKLENFSLWKKRNIAWRESTKPFLFAHGETPKLQRHWTLGEKTTIEVVRGVSLVWRDKQVIALTQENANKKALNRVGELREEIYKLEKVKAEFEQVASLVRVLA